MKGKGKTDLSSCRRIKKSSKKNAKISPIITSALLWRRERVQIMPALLRPRACVRSISPAI